MLSSSSKKVEPDMLVTTSLFLASTNRVCDYSPFISSLSNTVDLIAKAILPKLPPEEASKHPYYTLLKEKPTWRCFILLVPFAGNFIIWVYDAVTFKPQSKEQREAELYRKASSDAFAHQNYDQALKWHEKAQTLLGKKAKLQAPLEQSNRPKEVPRQTLVELLAALKRNETSDIHDLIGQHYKNNRQFFIAGFHFREALKYSSEENMKHIAIKRNLACCCFWEGYTDSNQSKYTEGLRLAKEVVKFYKDNQVNENSVDMGYALYAVSRCEFGLRVSSGVEKALLVLKILSQHLPPISEEIADAYNLAALWSSREKEPAKAIEYETTCLELWEQLGTDLMEEAWCYSNMGNWHRRLGQYKQARAHMATAINRAQRIGNHTWANVFNKRLAKIPVLVQGTVDDM